MSTVGNLTVPGICVGKLPGAYVGTLPTPRLDHQSLFYTMILEWGVTTPLFFLEGRRGLDHTWARSNFEGGGSRFLLQGGG